MTSPVTRDGELSTAEAEKIAASMQRLETSKRKLSGSYKIIWWQVDALIAGAFVALVFTGVPVLGKLTFASEVDQARDKAIEKATTPIVSRLDGIESKVNDVSALVKEQVVASLGSNICRYAVRRNKETDFDERSRLLNQINEMKAKYKVFTESEFNMNDC